MEKNKNQKKRIQKTYEVSGAFAKYWWDQWQIDTVKEDMERLKKETGAKRVAYDVHQRIFKNPKTKKFVSKKTYITYYCYINKESLKGE